ncbi:MAG: methyltransferase domain-containing protein [Nitrospirae bacterium]|nr:methyltransferase domain-containing protein [Nitrospirota bacterium]
MDRKSFEEAKELMKIWGAFRASRVLLTANNYRIFDHFSKPQSVKAVSQKLKTDIRATEILLDSLTGIGLLKKHNRKYLNTPLASKFLVKGSKYYQGNIIKHADSLWLNWSALDDVLKTGKPSRKAHDHSAFILGMDNLAIFKAKDVIKEIGLKGVRTALDLGGGPGTYAIEMAKKGVSVSLLDRPETVEIAKKVTGKAGVDIRFIEGDFLYDDIGHGYDLIFASQILHSNSTENNISLLKKCREALNTGGMIAIQEFLISDDRTQPMPGALFSVNMLVNTEGGRCYSPNEMKAWLVKTGFKKPAKK